MSMPRYQIIYPNCIFRAAIDFKNVVALKDKWAVGSLCQDEKGNICILNNKAGDGGYGFCNIHMDTLGLGSGYTDGDNRELFEGDIVRITRFKSMSAISDMNSHIYQMVLANNDIISQGNKDSAPERKVYSQMPYDGKKLMSVEGVVFLSNGCFYIQYYDKASASLNAMPLQDFYYYDMKPAPDVVVNIIGNIYDDEKLYKRVLRLVKRNKT